MIKNLESSIKLARPDERVEEELEGPRIGDDAVLLHQAEEGAGDWDDVRVEIAGPGLQEGLGDVGDEEGVRQLVRPRRRLLLGGFECMTMVMHWEEWRWPW